ncbi:MAG TPA: saccharopine dehydrogenase C-terminal domain-containing protein [candidate division Zixibacteria bacterium]|nr:saccharopine dehydrogenase C-terminal domain-containing protein [candidate division Zixibacteria bacterium]
MKYLVLGAGLMGRAVAYDLAHSMGTTEIRLADIDIKQVNEVIKWINSPLINGIKLDVTDYSQVLEAMKDIDSVIGCISYKFNYDISKLAIESKVNYCDLGGNNTIVQNQFTLNDKAEAAGITIIPDCGLAPGVASIIVTAGVEKFESLEEIHIRVGGLPQNPKPPLNYSMIFNVQGLTNEYIEIAEVIRDGKITKIDSLTEIEEIEFSEPFGKLEAFQTSGGTSTLPKTFLGKVNILDYKTIRYKGHCEIMKAIFDLGFKSEEKVEINECMISPREFLEKILVSNLTHDDNKDVTLVRIEVIGKINDEKKKLTYQIIDYYDEEKNITSMMRMTAFPASIIAQMMANGSIKEKGVITQEFNVPSKLMLEELRKRNINIEEKIE